MHLLKLLCVLDTPLNMCVYSPQHHVNRYTLCKISIYIGYTYRQVRIHPFLKACRYTPLHVYTTILICMHSLDVYVHMYTCLLHTPLNKDKYTYSAQLLTRMSVSHAHVFVLHNLKLCTPFLQTLLENSTLY